MSFHAPGSSCFPSTVVGLEKRARRLDPSDRAWIRHFDDYETAMTAPVVRRTLVGMRAADIVRGVDLLAGHPDVNAERISAFGCEGGAVPHPFDRPRKNGGIVLLDCRTPDTSGSVRADRSGRAEMVRPAWAGGIAGSPSGVDAADPMGRPADPDVARAAYSGRANVHVQRSGPSAAFAETYSRFLAKVAAG